MRWLFQVCALVLACADICFAVSCECMVKAVDSAGTEATYSMDIEAIFGPSKSCKDCNTKCESEINKNTNNGDLNFVPFAAINSDKLGTVICAYSSAPDLKSTTVNLFSKCDGGQPEKTKFAIKNPGYICCKNKMWPDADPSQGAKCEAP